MFLFPSLLPNGWRDEVRYGVLEEDGEEPSLCNIALRYPNRRNRDTNHDVAYSFTPFSRRQGAADAPVFTSFATKISSLFCATSSSSSSSTSSVPSRFKYKITNRSKWILVLSTNLPSLVSSSDSTCSHARMTPSPMLDFRLGGPRPTARTVGR